MKDILKRLKEANKSTHSYYRLRTKGYSVEEAFDKAIIKGSKINSIELDGISYSIKEAMKVLQCPVNYSAVMKRISRGMSPIEALTKPSNVK